MTCATSGTSSSIERPSSLSAGVPLSSTVQRFTRRTRCSGPSSTPMPIGALASTSLAKSRSRSASARAARSRTMEPTRSSSALRWSAMTATDDRLAFTRAPGTPGCRLQPVTKPASRPATASTPSAKGRGSIVHPTTATPASPRPHTATPSSGHHPPRFIGGGMMRAKNAARQAGDFKRVTSGGAGDALVGGHAQPLRLLAARRRRAQALGLVHALVGVHHRPHAEAFLELAPARCTAERGKPRGGGGHGLLRLAEKPGPPVTHDLRHRAPRPRDDGRAAGERLDQRQTERLRPVDRKQERERLSQELALLPVVDLAQEFDQ